MGLFPGCPSHTVTMALILEEDDFQYVLRIMNTNVEGKRKVMYALTAIKGIGRRFSNIVCKSADIDMNKRAGQLSNEEVERLMTVVQHPTQFKIPKWFLNRQKDFKDGKYSQILSNGLDSKLREDLERLKDQVSPRFASCLGTACAWSAHQDQRPSRTYGWCVQEEELNY